MKNPHSPCSSLSSLSPLSFSSFFSDSQCHPSCYISLHWKTLHSRGRLSSSPSSSYRSSPPPSYLHLSCSFSSLFPTSRSPSRTVFSHSFVRSFSSRTSMPSSSSPPPPLDSSSPSHSSSSSSVSCSPLPLSSFQLYLSPYRLRGPVNRKISKLREERELALLLRRHQEASTDPSTTALPSPHEVLPSSSSHRSKPFSRYSKTSISSDTTSDCFAPSEEGPVGREEEDTSDVKRKKSSSLHFHEGRRGGDIIGQHRAFIRRGGAYRDPLRGVEKNEGSNRAYEKFLSQGVAHAESRVVEVLRQARHLTRKEEEEKKKKDLGKERRRHSVLKMIEGQEEQTRDKLKDKRTSPAIEVDASRRVEKSKGREGELRGTNVTNRGSSLCEDHLVDHHTHLVSDSSSSSPTSPSDDVSSSHSISSSSSSSEASSSSSFSSFSSNIADVYFSHVHHVHMIAPPPKAFRDLHVKHLLLPSFSPNELYPSPSVLSLSPLAQVEEKVLEKQQAIARRHHSGIEERKTEVYLPISQEEERCKGQEEEEATPSRLLSVGRANQNDDLPSSSSSVSSPDQVEQEGESGYVGSCVHTPEKDVAMVTMSSLVTSAPSFDPLALRRKEYTDVYEDEEEEGEMEIFRQPWRSELVEEHAKVLAADIKAPGLLELQSQVKEEIEGEMKLSSYTRKNGKKEKIEEEKSNDASSVRNMNGANRQRSAFEPCHEKERDTEGRKSFTSSGGEDDYRNSRSSSSSSPSQESSLASSSSSSFSSLVELTQHHSSSSSSQSFLARENPSSSSCSSPSRLLETQSSLSAAPSLVLAAANARMRDRLVCQTYRRNRTNEDFLLTASHEDSSSELPCRAKPISCSSSSPGKDVLTSAGCGQPNASVRHEPCHLDYGRDETASCLPLCTSSPYRGESTPFEREEQEDDQGGVDTVKERREVKERKRTAVHLFSGEEDKSIYLSRGMSTSDISRPVCKSSSLVTSPTSPGCGENLSCTPNDSSVYTPPEKREMDLMSDIFEEALRGEASSSPSSEGTRHPTQEKESSPLGLPRDDGTEELYASLSSPLSSPARTLGRRRYRGAPREQAQVAPHAEDHRGEKTNEVGDGDWSIRSFSDEAMPSGQPFRGEMKFEARDHPFEGDVDELEREIFLGGEVGEREQQDERGRRREFDIVWKAQCAGLEGAEKLSSSEFSKTKKDLRDGRSSSRSNRGERKQEDEETSLSFPSSLQSSKRSNTLEEEDVVLGGKEEEERSPTISLSAHLNQEKERNVKKADSPQINNDEGHFSSGVQSSSLSQVNERGAVAEENDELAPDHHERFSSYSDSERRRRPDTKTKEMTNREEEEEEEKRQSGVGDVSFGLDDPFEMSRKVKKHESLIEFWRTEGGATVYENYNGCILPVQTQRGALAAYEATRKECALFDVSFRRVWYVKGQDRHQVLDMILTCDLERAMKTGDVQYGALLDSRGLILDECFVAKLSRHVEIWTSGAAPAHCFEYVAQFINYCRQCGLEVQLSPAPLAACVLSLQGPLALPLLGERLARYKNAEEGVQESTKEENEKEEKSLRGQSPTWELRSAWGAPMSIQQMLDMYYMTCFQLHLTVGNPQGISRTSDTSRPSSCRDSSSRTSKYMMTCLRAGSTGEDGVEIAFPSVKAALPFLRLLLDTRPLPQESCSTGRFLSSSPSSSSSASPSSSPCQLTDFTQDISLSEGSISFSSSSSSSRYVSVTLEDTPGPSVSGSSLASSSSVCTSPMRSPASVDLSTYRPTIGCLYALDMLRMEAGLPRMGVDIKTHHTLAHASLCCLLSLYKVRRQLLLCYQPIQRHVAFGSKIQRVGIVAGKEDRLRAINLWAHYEGMKRRKSQSLWLRRLNDETGRRGARQISNLDKGLHHDSRYPLQKLSSFLTRHTQSPSRKKSTGLHPPEEKEDERQSGEDEEEEDLYWAGEQREALKGWRSRPRIPGVNEKEGETTSLYALGGDDRPPPSSIFSAGRKQKPSDHVSRSYFPFHGCIILSNPHRRPIGVITSCSWSPHFKCRLAQGLVLREFAKHNQAILISVPLPVPAHWSSRRRGRALRSRRFRCLLTAQVHRLPFVQHRYPQPESELASSIERSFAKKTGPSSHSSSPAAEHKTNERKKLQKSVR